MVIVSTLLFSCWVWLLISKLRWDSIHKYIRPLLQNEDNSAFIGSKDEDSKCSNGAAITMDYSSVRASSPGKNFFDPARCLRYSDKYGTWHTIYTSDLADIK